MWERFIDTSMIYSGVVQEARRFGYQAGCPVSESVADRLITLPNYAALSGDDIDIVAQVFLSSLRACRDTGLKAAKPAELSPAAFLTH
jgi:dTDP-4-amino-4,6-dideoxygalactose transaminase